MLQKATNELRSLIASNRIPKFFERWAELVTSDSEKNNSIIQLRQDWEQLKKDEMLNLIGFEEKGIRRNRNVNGLLNLVSGLRADELVVATRPAPKGAAGMPQENGLRNLIERKLQALQRANILVTDAAEKFKLEEEINELKRQLENL